MQKGKKSNIFVKKGSVPRSAHIGRHFPTVSIQLLSRGHLILSIAHDTCIAACDLFYVSETYCVNDFLGCSTFLSFTFLMHIKQHHRIVEEKCCSSSSVKNQLQINNLQRISEVLSIAVYSKAAGETRNTDRITTDQEYSFQNGESGKSGRRSIN